MAVWKLTDSKCKAAKPSSSIYKLFDGEGLYLAVTPSGGKHWRISYRVNGKAQTHCLGPLERIALKDARRQLDDFKGNLFKGEVIKKVKSTEAVRVPTFAEYADLYWSRQQHLQSKTLNARRNLLKNHVLPHIGGKAITHIDRKMIIELLNAIDAKGFAEQVKNAKMHSSNIFKAAVIEGLVVVNPCDFDNRNLFIRKNVESRASIDVSEVPKFMAKLDQQDLTVAAQACRFLGLTVLRTTEMRLLEWSHVKGNILDLPASIMKGAIGKKRPFIVPLSTQALKILENMKEQNHNSKYIFPNLHCLDAPSNTNIVLNVIDNMGYKGVMTGHGWRSIFSTWANENNFLTIHIESQLAHILKDKTEGAYNKAKYLTQRATLIQAWANFLMPQAEECQLLRA
jgi:integrase